MKGDGVRTVGSGRSLRRPEVAPGPLRDLKELLYELYLAAGNPTLDQMAAAIAGDDSLSCAPSRDTIQRILSSSDVPPKLADVCALVSVLNRWTGVPPEQAGQLTHRATQLWTDAKLERPLGRPIRELVDPWDLEVHRAIEVPGPVGEPLPLLPAYVRRPHDDLLRDVVDEAVVGNSTIAMLVGGSSTGKTRACWEAVQTLPDEWRLWHPIDPERPRAAQAALHRVGPHTVVWLNESQHYLLTPGNPAGEEIAAGLRELLRDRRRGPVLVLGTMWPEYRATLMTEPLAQEKNPHAQARLLLTGREIAVPGHFDGAAMHDLKSAAAADPRLAIAAERAAGGGITQYLAGAPTLLDRFEAAPAGAKALLTVAMDARRLEHGPALPQAFLAAAAEAYFEDEEWDLLPEDWLEQALAYCARPVRGARGVLTRIRPRAGRAEPGDTRYRLADYLEQHARRARGAAPIPVGFWYAALHHTGPASAAQLGSAAQKRGLYRTSLLLRERAAAAGDVEALRGIANMLIGLGRTEEATGWYERAAAAGDAEALRWVATHQAFSGDVSRVLDWYRRAGTPEALRWAGNMLDLAGCTDEALDWFERAAVAGDDDALRWAANMLEREDRLDEALHWYEKAVRTGDLEALRWAANIQIARGRLEDAIDWHQRAASSGKIEVLRRTASFLATEGRVEEAIAWYERVAAMGDRAALSTAADLLYAEGRLADALVRYERAADAGDPVALGSAARALHTEGRVDEALVWYERAVQSGDTEALRTAADMLAASDRPDEALAWYERAAAAGYPGALYAAADMLVKYGRSDEAAALSRRLVERAPLSQAARGSNVLKDRDNGPAEALRRAASELADKGRIEEAIEAHQQAAEAGDALALCEAASLLARAGRLEEALDHYTKAAAKGIEWALTFAAGELADSGSVDLAIAWYERAAAGGDVHALTAAAYMLHAQGRVDDALTWYRRAAFAGEEQALAAAAGMLREWGRMEEGNSLERYGWELDGSIATEWDPVASSGG
ncbi:tetratricopeptide repeat protein [Streptomyces sp. NPDC052236]|uniref:tetratricopeptide repeat protein n=1 Tax=Streptomyces sp. NPDC052236 TaxID=3365686 RepID=UPI0037D10708